MVMISHSPVQLEEDKYHIPANVVNLDERTQVLNHFDTFGIFDRWGDVHPQAKHSQGIFHLGSRFISRLELRLNKQKPVLLGSSIKEDNDILSVDLTNPPMSDHFEENTLHILRSQVVRNGMYSEELNVSNYGQSAALFDLSITFDADFKDIFEIRGVERKVETNKVELTAAKNKIIFNYKGRDNIYRSTEIVFRKREDYEIYNNTIRFHFSLGSNKSQYIGYTIYFLSEEHSISTNEIEEKKVEDLTELKNNIKKDFENTRLLFADIFTSNEQFNHWL